MLGHSRIPPPVGPQLASHLHDELIFHCVFAGSRNPFSSRSLFLLYPPTVHPSFLLITANQALRVTERFAGVYPQQSWGGEGGVAPSTNSTSISWATNTDAQTTVRLFTPRTIQSLQWLHLDSERKLRASRHPPVSSIFLVDLKLSIYYLLQRSEVKERLRVGGILDQTCQESGDLASPSLPLSYGVE